MHIGHIWQSILCHLESNLGFRFLNSLGASEMFACNLQLSEPFSALGPLSILFIYGKRF